jgi:hypothetical protein
MFRVRCPCNRAGLALLSRNIKEFVPIPTGEGYTVSTKPFGERHRVSYMLGYVQKDAEAEHYQVRGVCCCVCKRNGMRQWTLTALAINTVA